MLCLAICGTLAYAQTDSVAEQDDDFVIASLVIADPGDVLYSCAGHACIRLQCSAHDLDYCFSYESENAKDKFWSFVAGNLKMGMMAIPTQEYIAEYASEGRGFYQYRFNLPLDVKKRLWELADNKLMQGMNLSYDYLHRGCAIASRKLVDEALYPQEIEYGAWPAKYTDHARSDLLFMAIRSFAWSSFVCRTMIGTEGDSECQLKDKLVVPADLLEMWKQATIDGKPLLDEKAEVLTPSTKKAAENTWCTPLMVAILLLIVAALGWWKWGKYIDVVLLVPQVLLGFFLSYLTFVSDLVCTNWTWLLIPFNPLPLLAWYWRKYWALPYAAILIIWCGVMVTELAIGHWMVDPAHIVWTMAIVLNYLSIKYRKKIN